MLQDTKKYELSLMLQSEENYPEVLNFLKGREVVVLEENALSRVKLAYPIKKQINAVFTFLILEALPDKVKEINDGLQILESVLRFLIITPPLKKRSERPQRAVREGKPRTDKPKKEVVSDKKESRKEEVISNELLEKKLEEILK